MQTLLWYCPRYGQKMLKPFVVGALILLGASAPGFAQTCQITGTVPESIRNGICGVATSVHGGEPPVNQLTLIVTREVAYTISAETPDAKDFMLTLLDRWMTDRNARVARVEVFFGRAHLATARTRVFGEPTVEFH